MNNQFFLLLFLLAYKVKQWPQNTKLFTAVFYLFIYLIFSLYLFLFVFISHFLFGIGERNVTITQLYGLL